MAYEDDIEDDSDDQPPREPNGHELERRRMNKLHAFSKMRVVAEEIFKLLRDDAARTKYINEKDAR